MTFLYYFVLVLHISACAFLIGVVLLQQGKGQDLASAFGGGSQAAFGPRGSSSVLSHATAILAGVFMVTSLSLSLVRPRERSLLDQIPSAPTSVTLPGAPESATPVATDPAPASEAAPGTKESGEGGPGDEAQPQG